MYPDEVLEISFSSYMISVLLPLDSLLKIASWNETGLSMKKIEDTDFVNLVNKFDICCLLTSLT